jgi:biopolymer transport protein ExbD
MSMLTNDSQDTVVSEINVTPLVDVMLVLLTVFIVTAPLLMNAVSVKLPKADANPTTIEKETGHISVTSDGNILLNEMTMTVEDLERQLTMEAKKTGYSVDIYADEKVEYGEVAKVMTAIQHANIAKFNFVMMPESVASTSPIN